MPGPDATNEEVDAAQQRAVDFISETCQVWTLELRERVAEAWMALWMPQTSRQTCCQEGCATEVTGPLRVACR